MHVILPQGSFKLNWDNWILLLVLYNAIAVPFEFGFSYKVATTPEDETFILFVWDVLVSAPPCSVKREPIDPIRRLRQVDLCFITDIVLNFAGTK